MTRKVRLTESKLRNMIQEAVSSALNEMDPRTWASARDKAMQRGQFGRGLKFHGYGVKTWDDEYGTYRPVKIDGGEMFKERYMDDAYYPNDPSLNNNVHDEEDVYFDDGNYENHKTNYVNNRNYGVYNQYMGLQNNLNNRGIRVAKEMNDGSGTYIKGKGWK